MFILSVVVGTLGGAVLALALARWAVAPASREVQRGYFNAFVTGLLLGAAIEVLPNALSALEIAARSLLLALAPEGARSSNGFWHALTQPSQVQLAVRSFGAAVVMLVFFRANAAQLLAVEETEVRGRRRLQLPVSETDYVGLVVIVAGLAGYAAWIGLSRVFLRSAEGALSLDVVALVLTSSLLSVTVAGLITDFWGRWWLLPAASLCLGLAAAWGASDRGEWLALEAGLAPLVVSAICLVYGIGRLLRLLQHEIGLGWRTTLTVAIGALVLYQSRSIL